MWLWRKSGDDINTQVATYGRLESRYVKIDIYTPLPMLFCFHKYTPRGAPCLLTSRSPPYTHARKLFITPVWNDSS